MSESFLTAAFLSISGGLQDAYTYICRGEVFANAQTGNIVLLSQSLVERKWSTVIHYLIPLGFFAMGIVVAEGYAFASTMCIGNIRSGMESLCVYGKTKDKEKLYKAGHYLGIIGMFAVGAAVGGHLILLLHERTIWVSCGLLFVGFLLMFIKEELEEHPRILEEEQEIRKNIQNIREEAKEVENIIKDDLKK